MKPTKIPGCRLTWVGKVDRRCWVASCL